MAKQKLKLTWIGTDARPKLGPRILLGDPDKSYHVKHPVTSADSFDNQLTFGDNGGRGFLSDLIRVYQR